MSKLKFSLPVINPFDLDDPDESDTPVIGGGTGESTPYPISYTTWMSNYSGNPNYDYNGSGTIDQADYYHWWTEIMHFTQEQWIAANGELPFGPGN